MLVLTRKVGESIIIDSQVRVTVIEVSGKRLRIGIDAPPDVCVDREEIHRRRMELFEPEPVAS